MLIHKLYRPFNIFFRKKRMRLFCQSFKVNAATRIIDVGGTEFNWRLIDEQPQVLIVNVDEKGWTKGRLTKVKGDGRALKYADNSFDIAYSNSVIEHVGDYGDQAAFAREIRRVAPSYYVQTPNKWFFIEPHLIAPFIHFFPFSVTRKLVRLFSVWGWVVRPTQDQTDSFLKEVRLLTIDEMRALFPDAEIVKEKVFWMTKSIIAARYAPKTK